MPEVLSWASMLLKMDSRLRGNDTCEHADYFETLISDFSGPVLPNLLLPRCQVVILHIEQSSLDVDPAGVADEGTV